MNAIIGYSEMLAEDAEDDGLDQMIPDLNKINADGYDGVPIGIGRTSRRASTTDSCKDIEPDRIGFVFSISRYIFCECTARLKNGPRCCWP